MTLNQFGENRNNQTGGSDKCTFRATPLPTQQEDVDAQEEVGDERGVVNTLLQCSELEDQLLQIINCQEWTEAVNGWKQTVPNPTYITHSSTPPQDEKANKRQDKDSRKEKQSHRKNPHQESLWRSKIEPGTYRYNPRYNPDYTWKFQGQNTRHYSNIQKRATDPQLMEHIERVREHLEKTLMKRDSDQSVSDVVNKGSRNQFNTNHVHNFMSHLSEYNQKKAEQIHVRLSQSLTDLKSSVDKPLFLQASPAKAHPLLRDAEPGHLNPSIKLANAGGDHFSKPGDCQLPFVTIVAKRPDNEGDNNGDHSVNQSSNIRLEDKENNNLRRPKKFPERHSSAGKLPSNNLSSKSFEKFPAFTIPHQDQQLSPLTKLTPSLRKVSDDNEVIMVQLNGGRCDASPSSAPPAMSTRVREHTPVVRKESPQQYLTRVDAPNKNFIHTGISGKSVSPANQRKLKGKSTRLITKETSMKARKAQPTTPHRLASLGKPSEYTANPLDSLHRGAFERDTATALASEILPGISGRKVGVPVLSHRVL